MNYWLHRIKHVSDVSYPLLGQGYLTIGFSDFSNKNFLKKTIADDGDYFDSKFEESWGFVPRSRYSLWYFLSQMKKGDIVIVPKWGGIFSIHKLVSPEPILICDVELNSEFASWIKKHNNLLRVSDENDPRDLGFAWKVKPIAEDISRLEYADAKLTSKMKYRGTTLYISDLEESIKRSIASASNRKPISLKDEMAKSKVTKEKWLEKIREVSTPDKFEKLIKWYFEKVGAKVEIPPKNKREEGDVDIMATIENIKTIIHVQAKFHKGTTDDYAVKQIKNFADSSYLDTEYQNQLWVISTADSFTKTCIKEAEKNSVLLLNGEQFADLLNRFTNPNELTNL